MTLLNVIAEKKILTERTSSTGFAGHREDCQELNAGGNLTSKFVLPHRQTKSAVRHMYRTRVLYPSTSSSSTPSQPTVQLSHPPHWDTTLRTGCTSPLCHWVENRKKKSSPKNSDKINPQFSTEMGETGQEFKPLSRKKNPAG